MIRGATFNGTVVLQETEFQQVESFVSEAGDRFVRKTYKKPSRSLEIECAFLESASEANLSHLALPVLVDRDAHSFTMTFVDRENQTRDSILKRKWDKDDVDSFLSAIEELQALSLPTAKFSAKQRTMGFVYPAIKMLMLSTPSLKRGIIGSADYAWMMRMVIGYLFARPWIHNCTVHYDLTTLNCAFTPSGKVSILDFEFPYCYGDSLFDLCYFATIPPQSMADWTYQKEILSESIRREQRFAALRCRVILSVCCLVRALFFESGSFERNQYLSSLELLKNQRRFDEYFGVKACN